jgi:hypothetical protein
LALAVALWMATGQGHDGLNAMGIVAGVAAVAIWLIGRACRYILAGK